MSSSIFTTFFLFFAVVFSLAGPALAETTLAIKADAADALIVDDAPRSVTVTVNVDEPTALQLQHTFIDRYGKVTEGQAQTIRAQPGQAWSKQIDVPVDYYGPTTYRATLVDDAGNVIAQAEQILIRPVPVPRLSVEQRADSPIGINTHANAHWETMAAMGVHWGRDYSWYWMGRGENVPVAANRTNFAAVADKAEQAGITILPVMQQVFRTENKQAFRTDGDMIATAYERLSDAFPQYEYWELDNEADLTHRDQTTDAYAHWYQTYLQYIQHADRGLDAAGHGAKVVLNGEAGIHPDRARDLIEKVGDHFAVVNYHYYTGTTAPELAMYDINKGAEDRPRSASFLDQMREINRIAHEAGKEAWLTEIAWSARGGPAVGDRLQSAYLHRIYLLGEWAGTDKTFWFWDRNMRGEGRFSSTGLIDDEWGALPAGAAMAAVSKFIGQADYAGSVDIGDGRWCLLFQRPEGGWTVAAWAVGGEYELPAELADVEQAFGMYANPLRDRKLTDEPTYFFIDELPAAWAGQRHVERISASVADLFQGSRVQVEVQANADDRLTWADLPDGATGGDWSRSDGRFIAELNATPQLAVGEYRAAIVASGEGWSKRLPVTLKVRPAVDVQIAPYSPGETSEVALRSRADQPVTATLNAPTGSFGESQLKLDADGSASTRFTAPDDATGPITIEARLSNGATQQYDIRPRHLDVPKAESITIDGKLTDWPDAGTLNPAWQKINGPEDDFKPTMKLTWSDQGLYVASVMPVGPNFRAPAKPDSFWEWTSLEMNMNAFNVHEHGGKVNGHLFWFVPQKDEAGNWRVYAGEWQKAMPDGTKQTIKDDERPTTAMTYDGQNVTMEVLIPIDVLGEQPRAGHRWRMTLHSKTAEAHIPRTLSIWPAAPGKGWASWGYLNFVE